MTKAGIDVRVRTGRVRAAFGDLGEPNLSTVIQATEDLESLLIACAARDFSTKSLDDNLPRMFNFVKAREQIDESVVVSQLTMQSPYEIYLVVAGGATAVSSAVAAAIYLFRGVNQTRVETAEVDRDVELALLKRDAYRAMRDHLHIEPSWHRVPSEERRQEFDSGQVLDESDRAILNRAINALITLKQLEVVEDDSNTSDLGN